ncbi:MAG: C4-type zinc ribbon domain-containing protein [Candidatus Omnitrophica bacterium]|nr:C4-type zinc ribbon domain-containing protein [Candidatus Omnitrophota bacterium]
MATVQEELEKLLELQEIDSKLQDINTLLQELPAQLRNLEREDVFLRQEMEEFKKATTHLKVERRQKETELKAIEEQIKSLQSKLFDVKTNKEYQALQSEIQNLKMKASSLEDEILVHMEQDEQLKEKEKSLLLRIEQHKKIMVQKQREIEDKIEKLKAEQLLIQQERDECASNINRLLIDLYTRVKKSKKDGIAVCRISEDSNGCVCGGCYVYIPGYLREKVKKKTEIVQCENCGRILAE